MKFRTRIVQSGKTTTGIEVPPEIVEALGAGKRPAVAATVNGYTYRSSVASMGGKYMLSVSAEIRQIARLAGGDEVEVVLELDAAPRTVTVPADFRSALDADDEASRFFDSLAYSHRLRHVLAVDGAKTPETRQRRIAKAVADMRAGKK